ncbi:PDR/VanB family oxidoreductase [Albimonas sp. CAU 1670]|uniref:PDR/VanB family oxidoreductase n=1 Tax=Albimonas sp. CAU 1670 TaxID=3032599 RepID=UPI0023DA4567|nr:PDR/VanB family oxidoreductase [Albimonas sp. CAU 1670]MDF2232975.1 PDR/VanB family oxidoreductase [Albimonas sp. CAU 1670]
MAAPRLIMKLEVAALRDGPGEVRIVEFAHPRRPTLPGFAPGAHVDVHLPFGGVRQYSLIGDPAETGRYVIAVKREAQGRGGSAWVHEGLAVGDLVPVSAPRNHFAIPPGEGPALLLAGGIGATPLIAMARALEAQGAEWRLHHFVRDRAEAPLRHEIAAVLPAARVTLHDAGAEAARRTLAALLADPPPDGRLMHCGPPGFMAAVAEAAQGWPEGSVASEAFQPLDDGAPPAPFAIRLRDGREVTVPADRSALDALREAGVALNAACENGVCGTCECGLLAGEAIHRDQALSPMAQARRFIPCVSRGRGVIALDL